MSNPKEYIEKIFQEKNLASKQSFNAKRQIKHNCSVLPSNKTNLVGCFFDPKIMMMFTIDANCLLRSWDIRTGECIKSYPLEIAEESGGANALAETAEAFKAKAKIHCVKLAPDNKHLMVAFEGGVVQVHHLYSGQIVFNKKLDEALNLEQEIANLAFGSDQASFWFIATCWEGRVAFFSLP